MVSGFTSYTFHGGGPALGALYLAVMPPLTTVGSHPSFLKASAIRCRRAGSTILLAGPWTTISKSSAAIVTTEFALRAMFLALRVLGPVLKQNASSTNRTPIGITCGLPSGLTVANQAVCRSGPPVFGAIVNPFSIPFYTLSHGMIGAP